MPFLTARPAYAKVSNRYDGAAASGGRADALIRKRRIFRGRIQPLTPGDSSGAERTNLAKSTFSAAVKFCASSLMPANVDDLSCGNLAQSPPARRETQENPGSVGTAADQIKPPSVFSKGRSQMRTGRVVGLTAPPARSELKEKIQKPIGDTPVGGGAGAAQGSA